MNAGVAFFTGVLVLLVGVVIIVAIARWVFRITDILTTLVTIANRLEALIEATKGKAIAVEAPTPPPESSTVCQDCKVPVTPAKPYCSKCGQRVRFSRAA